MQPNVPTLHLASIAIATVTFIALSAACSSTDEIARDKSNGSFTVGTPCADGFPSCGFTDLDCDARTNKCVKATSCASNADCPDLFGCRMGIKSCATACFEFDSTYCKAGSRCDYATNLCVGSSPSLPDGGGAGSDRTCPPNCTVGHECCAGSCSGPAVQMPNDCCSCLPGEVSSATCGGGHCG